MLISVDGRLSTRCRHCPECGADIETDGSCRSGQRGTAGSSKRTHDILKRAPISGTHPTIAAQSGNARATSTALSESSKPEVLTFRSPKMTSERTRTAAEAARSDASCRSR